jgi:hypothetical protein
MIPDYLGTFLMIWTINGGEVYNQLIDVYLISDPVRIFFKIHSLLIYLLIQYM